MKVVVALLLALACTGACVTERETLRYILLSPSDLATPCGRPQTTPDGCELRACGEPFYDESDRSDNQRYLRTCPHDRASRL